MIKRHGASFKPKANSRVLVGVCVSSEEVATKVRAYLTPLIMSYRGDVDLWFSTDGIPSSVTIEDGVRIMLDSLDIMVVILDMEMLACDDFYEIYRDRLNERHKINAEDSSGLAILYGYCAHRFCKVPFIPEVPLCTVEHRWTEIHDELSKLIERSLGNAGPKLADRIQQMKDDVYAQRRARRDTEERAQFEAAFQEALHALPKRVDQVLEQCRRTGSIPPSSIRVNVFRVRGDDFDPTWVRKYSSDYSTVKNALKGCIATEETVLVGDSREMWTRLKAALPSDYNMRLVFFYPTGGDPHSRYNMIEQCWIQLYINT